MKIYRGGRTGRRWTLTDEKSLDEWAAEWFPDAQAEFDLTGDKSGTRHTDLAVTIDASEILALTNGLVKYLQGEAERTQKSALEAETSAKTLRTAMSKIHNLVAVHRDEAPSLDELLDAVQSIAAAYGWGFAPDSPPRLDWIDGKASE